MIIKDSRFFTVIWDKSRGLSLPKLMQSCHATLRPSSDRDAAARLTTLRINCRQNHPGFSLKVQDFLVVAGKSRRNGMAPAHAIVFLSLKPGTENAVIQATILFLAWSPPHAGHDIAVRRHLLCHRAREVKLEGAPREPPPRELISWSGAAGGRSWRVAIF